MAIPRLRIDDTLLLVVDVQGRLMPTLPDPDTLIAHTAILLQAASALGLPAIVTEQYPRGLGATVPEVAAHVGEDVPVFEKTRFSAITPEVDDCLRDRGRDTILVCGIEAHICVLQSVLDLRAAGRDVFFCTDAVSAGQPSQIPHAFRRMEAAGAVPTGILSALYELMADKQHPAFARCLELAKAVRGS
jgi:nicotinamidase-related amidase